MADKIRLEIVSAEEELFSEDVEMVYAPAEMGEVGVSPKHTTNHKAKAWRCSSSN